MEEQHDKEILIGSNLLFGNIQGLYNNTDLTKPRVLLDLAKSNDVFCICIVETHLNDNISDAEITESGWNIFRGDRNGRICGGAAIYLDENIPISEKFSYSNSVCESVGKILDNTKCRWLYSVFFNSQHPSCY